MFPSVGACFHRANEVDGNWKLGLSKQDGTRESWQIGAVCDQCCRALFFVQVQFLISHSVWTHWTMNWSTEVDGMINWACRGSASYSIRSSLAPYGGLATQFKIRTFDISKCCTVRWLTIRCLDTVSWNFFCCCLVLINTSKSSLSLNTETLDAWVGADTVKRLLSRNPSRSWRLRTPHRSTSFVPYMALSTTAYPLLHYRLRKAP